MTTPDLSDRPLSVTVERSLALPPTLVYDAWTRGFDRWFAAPGSAWMRPEPGAAFAFETRHPESGQRYPHYGRFLRLTQDRLVELTWVTGTGGTEGAETVVTVELTEEDGGTRLRLTHAGFPNTTARDRHAEAWPHVLEHMERRLSTPDAPGTAGG